MQAHQDIAGPQGGPPPQLIKWAQIVTRAAGASDASENSGESTRTTGEEGDATRQRVWEKSHLKGWQWQCYHKGCQPIGNRGGETTSHKSAAAAALVKGCARLMGVSSIRGYICGWVHEYRLAAARLTHLIVLRATQGTHISDRNHRQRWIRPHGRGRRRRRQRPHNLTTPN